MARPRYHEAAGKNDKDKAQCKRQKGSSKAKGRDVAPHSGKSRSDVRAKEYFGDRHRVVIRDHYVSEFRSGRCPPGLAKKSNGCMQPGQAKKWKVGYPLPRDVIFYDLPPALVIELGRPPTGYRYVRVASDILLIAIGTGLIVDAILDLGTL